MRALKSTKRERQTKDLLANKPRQHIRAMQRGNVITAAYLNTVGRACNNTRLGAGIPEQKEFGFETLPVVVCDCATYRNVDLGDENLESTMLDHYALVRDNYNLILLNNQDNEAENGIWSFDSRREEMWQREYLLHEETLWQTLVFIRDGLLFAGCTFTWSYENFLRPHFQLPMRVHTASYEDEELSGTELTAEGSVNAGDAIFVKDKGVYIVEEEDWRLVAEPGTETIVSGGTEYNVAVFTSQEVAMLTDPDDTDDCGLKYYDFAVAPPELKQEP